MLLYKIEMSVLTFLALPVNIKISPKILFGIDQKAILSSRDEFEEIAFFGHSLSDLD
ncbi:hypothetical protein UA3_02523 [Enterococcus faecium EnGen0263]|nr:hypothetical protein UA3_02523 [Enterococcus faecium EnGen0263]